MISIQALYDYKCLEQIILSHFTNISIQALYDYKYSDVVNYSDVAILFQFKHCTIISFSVEGGLNGCRYISIQALYDYKERD